MSTLVELHEKNNHTTDKWGHTPSHHSYLPVYDELFARLKDRNIRILEIGVYKGDSLRLWAEYFIGSQIFGIDAHPWQIEGELPPNVHIINTDAYADAAITLLNTIGKFDIIIDDGSHAPFNQDWFIVNYLPLLTDDGIMIIEEAGIDIKDGEMGVFGIEHLFDMFPKELLPSVWWDDRRKINGNGWDSLLIFDKSKL